MSTDIKFNDLYISKNLKLLHMAKDPYQIKKLLPLKMEYFHLL